MSEEVHPLIREDGKPFTDVEIADFSSRLGSFSSEERTHFRDANASAIASHGSERMLVVGGPGTGKSHMFRSRLKRWLAAHPDARVAVATFVRKLAEDLRAEIECDEDISGADRARVEVNTLHAVARSIVERGHGTHDLPLQPHCRIVLSTWEELVWDDVFCLLAEYHPKDYAWADLRAGLFDGEPPTEGGWVRLREAHLRLQQFYNALTFPDLILLATQVIIEKPEFARDTLFIFDEFQDFNLAEEALIRALTRDSPALLLVGDDDQVLYDQLRRSHPSIIRRYYEDQTFANAMLPFCIRCGLHICRAAESFLAAGRPRESIAKVFVPLHDDQDAEPVRVVAATTPGSGVDFISAFIEAHRVGIRERQEAIREGREKDPYLLILTPARELTFLTAGGARERLLQLLAEFIDPGIGPSQDYMRICDYNLSAVEPHQNFTMRRVLANENVDVDALCGALREALSEQKDLVDVKTQTIAACQEKCLSVRDVLRAELAPTEQVERLEALVGVSDPDRLCSDLERFPAGMRAGDEEHSGFEQRDRISAVQLTTIVGSKGLSADHVVVLGCDEVNLAHASRSAFFVAITRARKSLALMICVGGGGASTLHEFVVGLPDDHTEALLAKAGGVMERYPSIGAVQDHLEKMQYARQRRSRGR